MASHPWLSLRIEELLKVALSGEMGPQHPDSVGSSFLSENGPPTAQLQAAAGSAKAGDRLAAFTRALVAATWTLAGATLVLVVVTAVPIFLKCAR